MNKRDYNKLNQEILDVMLYNQKQCESYAKEISDILEENKTYLQDSHALNKETDCLLSSADAALNSALKILAEKNISVELPEPEEFEISEDRIEDTVQEMSWEDIVKAARASGIKNTTFNDILTDDELFEAHKEYDEITKAFDMKVRLKKKDWMILMLAVTLQVIRQYFLTPLDLSDITVDASEAERKVKKKYDNGGKFNDKYYYATMDCIVKQKFVPYDAIAGSKAFNFAGKGKGIAGTNHRYYTLGHDPVLYAIFGTANILTNTMTRYDAKTYHVKYVPNSSGRKQPQIVACANTEKMFQWTLRRIEESCRHLILFLDQLKTHPQTILELPDILKSEEFANQFAPLAAFIKAKMHLESDNSKNGLPLPFLEIFASPERALELSKYGYNAANLDLLLKGVNKQITGSIIINFFIGLLHGYLCKYEENTELIYTEVRTRKILLLSNLIATSSNVVSMAVIGILAAYTGNIKAGRFAYRHIDLGGAIVTLYRTFTDLRFIDRVRDEFIKKKMDENLSRILDELNDLESDLAL